MLFIVFKIKTISNPSLANATISYQNIKRLIFKRYSKQNDSQTLKKVYQWLNNDIRLYQSKIV